MKLISKNLNILLLGIVIGLISTPAHSARLKDISNFQGVRSNQLLGYGLGVGLDGTGDSTSSDVMKRSLAEALAKLGIGADPSKFQIKNVASVMVTATLPPFTKSGSTIDVMVSSIGDSKSLQGGTLLMTPLKAANQEVYGVAQGPISIGGFQVSANLGATQVKENHQTVGKIPNGASVEKEVDFSLNGAKQLEIGLNTPDFTTATRIANVINEFLEGDFAFAPDSGSVSLKVPGKFSDKISTLIANVEVLEVEPDVTAKVILNERTGTVVMGENVRVSTVAVSHGNLSIQIDQTFQVSQPNPFSGGKTKVTSETQLLVQDEKDNKLVIVPEGISIGEIVRALNAIGVKPRDLITVLQSIKSAGALHGELTLI